jgi:hypothetical protein
MYQFFFKLQLYRFRDELPFDWEEPEEVYHPTVYSKVCISPDGQFIASLLVS